MTHIWTFFVLLVNVYVQKKIALQLEVFTTQIPLKYLWAERPHLWVRLSHFEWHQKIPFASLMPEQHQRGFGKKVTQKEGESNENINEAGNKIDCSKKYYNQL